MALHVSHDFRAYSLLNQIHDQVFSIKYSMHHDKEKNTRALAGVAQWMECEPANQRVVGLNPSQGTCLGCRPGPQ